jgi:aminoglycoside phosphotransferase (APT) family kinase protein
MPEPGPLIASGRAADVYEYGNGLVLRRYRTPHDCLYEAAVMQHVHAHGYPVPRVVEVSGGDIVMERIEGPTMLTALGKRPWRIRAYTKVLSGLIHRLHAIPVTGWMQNRLGGGGAVVHLDLHPDNVMLTPRGPVVIDWSNAGRGAPEVEVADLWLLMANANIPGSRATRTLLGAGRKLFLRGVLRTFDLDPVRRSLPVALEHRLGDRNMLPDERERMKRFVERNAI